MFTWTKFWQLWESDTSLFNIPYHFKLTDYLDFWVFDDKGVFFNRDEQTRS